MKGERFTHESFAQIQFNRVEGKARFYGSELEQDHYIMMEIAHSVVERDLTHEWHFTDGRPLIRLRMSAGQFSELITSLNRGSGIPCTLEYFDGKKVAELPDLENRKEFVHRKFKDRMKEFAESIKENQQKALSLVKKKTLNKQEVQDLTFYLERLTSELSSNIPFFAKCFQEVTDEVVLEAKKEIENAIQHKINVLGLEALHAQNKLLK